MKPLEIKADLSEKGYSISMVARVMKKSPSTISGVICRHTTSMEVATGLSKILKKPIPVLFPDVPAYLKAEETQKKESEIAKLLEVQP